MSYGVQLAGFVVIYICRQSLQYSPAASLSFRADHSIRKVFNVEKVRQNIKGTPIRTSKVAEDRADTVPYDSALLMAS